MRIAILCFITLFILGACGYAASSGQAAEDLAARNYGAETPERETPIFSPAPVNPDTGTTIDYQPADNFHFNVNYVLLEWDIQVHTVHEGVLWAIPQRTGQLLRSDNQGGNWTPVYEFLKPIRAVHIDQAGNIFVSVTMGRFDPVGTGEIFRSSDGGETFTSVLALKSGGAENWNIASRDGLMFISEYGYKGRGDNARRIYRSQDWGLTWEIVFDPGPRYNYHLHKILILDDGTIYQSVGDGRNAEILRSLDNGDTWHTAVSGLQPTSAIVLEDYILWGLDGGPWCGVARYNRRTGEVTRAFETPYPFKSSNYAMVKAHGVIYAMFLSYGGNYSHPGSIFFSKDEGVTWELLGYITKEPEWGVGFYHIVADEQFAYVNMCAPIYRYGLRYAFAGTLRFELIIPEGYE